MTLIFLSFSCCLFFFHLFQMAEKEIIDSTSKTTEHASEIKSNEEVDNNSKPVDSADIMSSSENMNNENREKELNAAAVVAELTPTPEEITETLEKPEEPTVEPAVDATEKTTDTLVDGNEKTAEQYAENVTYSEEGVAIYTDPATKYQYEWDKEKKEWIPSKNAPLTTDATKDNPYENEHYRWCHDTKKWIRKDTEFYKWCIETETWIPKTETATVAVFKDGVHTYTDKDGAEFFWDTEKNAWFPKIDDDFMARYQMNYGFIDNTTPASKPVEEPEEEEEEEEEDDKEDKPEKEKDLLADDIQALTNEAGTADAATGKKRKQPEPAKWFELPPEKNTKVYVTNLPLDTTEEEFSELMSKYGLVMKDPQTNKLKIKLYREGDGQLKGDALCHYIKVSVYTLH
jgi:HIV Tat-specific factor 1